MSSLILKPVISEKSIMLAAQRVYTFEVPMQTNKIEVGRAVKAAFNVDATDVRIIITKGKVKRFKGKMGKRVDVKKALVSLKDGQTISVFEAEAETKEDKKDKKPVKKTEDKKSQSKESK